jgi:hypothetical protein
MASILPFLVLVAVFVIPFVYHQRFGTASKRAAFWLKPNGNGFIFHPFGRRGRAYLVSSAAAHLIKARVATRTKIFYSVLLAAIVPSLIFASLDPADFIQLRPYLSAHRCPSVRGHKHLDLASTADSSALCRCGGIECADSFAGSASQAGGQRIVGYDTIYNHKTGTACWGLGLVRGGNAPSNDRGAFGAPARSCHTDHPDHLFQVATGVRHQIRDGRGSLGRVLVIKSGPMSASL